MGKKKGRGRRQRERQGRGGETHLGDLNSSDHRLQTLGHHGERERGGRGRGRLVHREGRGRRGRVGRTGPGWATPQIQTHDTHDH
jgi:hypothetical protein